MSGVRRGAIAAVACVLLLGAAANAQTANPPRGNGDSAPTFTIAGTAVNARTGEVLAQARISLAEPVTRSILTSMTTGANGHFAFAGLRAGKYALQGAKRGFLPAAYDQHEGFSTAIVTGPDFATEQLELRLTPMALITGHVYDEFGEGLRGAHVHLYYEYHNGGISRIMHRSFASTDDRGYYEFNLLQPGNYYVAATAKPWYAMHAVGGSDNAADTGHIPAALDVAYSTTYYGGATEAEQATPLEINGGDQQQIDIHLSPVQALRLRIRAPETPDGHGYSLHTPMLQKRVFDGVEALPTESFRMVAPGEFEISGVPPGRYTVRADNPNSGQMEQSTEQDLQRDGQELNATHGEPLASLKVTLKMLSGEPLPKPYFVALLGPRRFPFGINQGDGSGEVTFADLAPGTYTIRVSAQGKTYGVTRTSSAAGDSPGHDVTVTAGAAMEVTALVVSGDVTIDGAVQKNGKPIAGVMVALVPKDPEHHRELFRRDQSDFDGTFHLAGVIPGNYTLVAVEDAWGSAWMQPEVLARYVQHGRAVNVGEAVNGNLRLPEPVEVQPR